MNTNRNDTLQKISDIRAYGVPNVNRNKIDVTMRFRREAAYELEIMGYDATSWLRQGRNIEWSLIECAQQESPHTWRVDFDKYTKLHPAEAQEMVRIIAKASDLAMAKNDRAQLHKIIDTGILLANDRKKMLEVVDFLMEDTEAEQRLQKSTKSLKERFADLMDRIFIPLENAADRANAFVFGIPGEQPDIEDRIYMKTAEIVSGAFNRIDNLTLRNNSEFNPSPEDLRRADLVERGIEVGNAPMSALKEPAETCVDEKGEEKIERDGTGKEREEKPPKV